MIKGSPNAAFFYQMSNHEQISVLIPPVCIDDYYSHVNIIKRQ